MICPSYPAMHQKSDPTPAQPMFTHPNRLRRFACMMYEGVLLFGVIFLAGYAFDTLTQSRDAMMFRHVRQAILFFAIGVYFVLSWHRQGQTLPMKTWNVRLADANGHRPGMGRLIARYLLLWPVPLLAALIIYVAARYTGYGSMDLLIVFTPFALFVWTWFDPQKQFLHDRLLGTQLIDSRQVNTYASQP